MIKMEVFSLDEGSVLFQVHESCFNSQCQPDTTYDNPKEHGHIPSNAKCAFCGKKLPIIGRHPYCFDIGDFIPEHRYWAHSECMKDALRSEELRKLPY